MGKNRDRLTIVAAILESASTNGGACKTRIMYQCNLSFALLEKYLKAVIKAGFIQVDDNIYRLTGRGRQFLSHYQDFSFRFLHLQQLLEAVSSERERLARQLEKPAVEVPLGSIVDSE